jgi:hypothetical protein
VQTTAAPAAAKRSVTARPIPDAAPVTMTHGSAVTSATVV